MTIRTQDILNGTSRVAIHQWKLENWQVFLEIDGTPGCISFSTAKLMKTWQGNPNPVEWRIEEEFNESAEIDPKKVATHWRGMVEEFEAVGVRGDSYE